MKKLNYSNVLRIVFVVGIFTSCSPLAKITKQSDGISIVNDSATLEVKYLTDKIIHVTYRPLDSQCKTLPLMMEKREPNNTSVKVRRKNGLVFLSAGATQVRINTKNNQLTFNDADGKLLLREDKRILSKIVVPNDSGYSVRQYFKWQPGEALFGLGQQQSGIMNWRGHKVELFQQNKYIAIPAIISSAGYGLLWNNYSYTSFSDTTGGSFFQSELADQVDYYFINGPKADSIIGGFRYLTGDVPMLPKWALGYIQSKERYKTQDEIISVAKEFRKRQIPFDCIVLDWRYWTGDEWGQKSFDSTRFPDPAAMMNILHNDLNAHLMISVWPKLGGNTRDFKEMKSNPGFLYSDTAQQSLYDAFNSEARNLYWNQANHGLFSKGIDAWWCDATEPELMNWVWNTDNYRKIMKPSIGSGSRYMNGYSLMQSKGMYENQRQTSNEKRVLILTRSGFLGLQKYGAATWSGDIDGTWDVFKKQIPAGLNFCMSGIPFWTTDIGGFFVKGIENFTIDRDDERYITNEHYKELYVRWFQYAVFCPLFRAHGTDYPREIWRFGEPGTWAYDALLQADKLRYQLIPYIYSNASKISLDNYTLMRALIFDFPDDSAVYNIPDQFMFGSSILVNPVTDSSVISRKLYLPKADWFDFYTGDKYQGGEWITVSAPISHIPIFVKAGSIIPMANNLQAADEISDQPLTIWIFPGADAKFELYEDEGDNYNYEKGQYSKIPITWDDSGKKLTLEAIQGDYPGMIKKRVIHVIIAGKDKIPGLMKSKTDHTIEYNGDSFSAILDSN